MGSLLVFSLTFPGSDGFFPFGLLLSVGLLVIMIGYVVVRMLSSSVEYIYTRLYNSSIVAGGLKTVSGRKKWMA